MRIWSFDANRCCQQDEQQQLGLVARVCKGDSSLQISASQSDAYSTLRAYVGDEWGSFAEAPGVQMCILAVAVWVLTHIEGVQRGRQGRPGAAGDPARR